MSAADPPAKRLWRIHGKTYDLTAFLAKHPGGPDALGFGRDVDATALFESYHLRKAPPPNLLTRYEVLDALPPTAPSRFTFASGDFYTTVRSRVRAHFAETGTSTRASLTCQLLALFGIAATIALTYPAFVMGSVWAAIAHGLVRAMTSVGPGHSMSHFSVFPRGRWNHLVLRIASPVLVSNPAIWTTAHVVSHHAETLTLDDLQDHYPLKRVQPAQRHRAWHRGQHVYSWLVYALGLPLWLAQDLVLAVISLFGGKHGTRRFSFAQRLENTFAIAANIFCTMGLPFLFLSPGRALLVAAISNVISGLILVLQIQVNHEVPEASAASIGNDPIDWGAYQVRTSHNYATRSWWMLHFSGGLNMQIEHHLFPGVHYTRFGPVSAIVRQACIEFGLPYQESGSLAQALGKHYAVLLALGRPAVVPVVVPSVVVPAVVVVTARESPPLPSSAS